LWCRPTVRESAVEPLPNLRSGHLVVCFDTDYAFAKAFARETFFELSLCLAWTKEQDGFCFAKVRDHLVIA